jgi:hypothetical protein
VCEKAAVVEPNVWGLLTAEYSSAV